MTEKDISTALTHKLSVILEDCRRIEPALAAYLKTNEERPNISFELLRILSRLGPHFFHFGDRFPMCCPNLVGAWASTLK